MKGIIGLAFLLMIINPGAAQLHPAARESTVGFKIKNFGFNVNGSFNPPEGEIRFNPDSLSAARFDVSVDAASVNTDNNMRDGHLRGEDYLDVKTYPRIRFLSKAVRAARKKDTYLMTGDLTIRNKTKEISFPFTASASGNGYLFTGSFVINRKDFGVGGSSTISDELTVELKVAARP
jgi:polyisoprenoid-binding protein YceI